jgi:hypothetical protein
MFLRSGLDTTPDITLAMRERENAERQRWHEQYVAERGARKAMSAGAKAHATMAAKKAKQLAAIEKRKATIAAKHNPMPDPSCPHAYLCTEWHREDCCACADKRPHDPTGYVAYNNTNLADISRVARNHYYCPECKARLQNDEAMKQYIADAPFNAFGRTYYDGLREAYNVAGAEMEEWFCVFKSLGCDHDRFMDYLRRDKLTDWDALIDAYSW